jgi:hypothetical protein
MASADIEALCVKKAAINFNIAINVLPIKAIITAFVEFE